MEFVDKELDIKANDVERSETGLEGSFEEIQTMKSSITSNPANANTMYPLDEQG